MALVELLTVYQRVSSGCAQDGIHGALPGRCTCVVRRLVFNSSNGGSHRACRRGVLRAVVRTKRTSIFVLSLYSAVGELVISGLRVINSVFSENTEPSVILSSLVVRRNISVR